MKVIRIGVLILLAVLCGVSQTRSAEKSNDVTGDREKLTGAWHLVSMAGPEGKPIATALPTGMLIYTRDGHMSVQLMYPASQTALSNEYVQNGYEASFGSYEVNATNHTVTHHVRGANTGERLVGKDLPRSYQFTANGRLVIKSARPDEHWSVTWEHY
ncbi:MAG: lipocalin-like domain-containing protein [Acidobacteriota bacterium]|nr:lipocalin-like domain-containing protein [Acidobacteriota bacterium]